MKIIVDRWSPDLFSDRIIHDSDGKIIIIVKWDTREQGIHGFRTGSDSADKYLL